MTREVKSAKRRHAIHERWARDLAANLPIGVPAETKRTAVGTRPWPATFGDIENGRAVHRPDEEMGSGYCLQCLHCRFYDPLDSALGADWGACVNAMSQYDRQVVFEHWTCAEFEYGE